MNHDELISLLESLLPYVKHAKSEGLPNAAYYAELLDNIIWQPEHRFSSQAMANGETLTWKQPVLCECVKARS